MQLKATKNFLVVAEINSTYPGLIILDPSLKTTQKELNNPLKGIFIEEIDSYSF
jgi:hypothetical protein